MKAPSAYVTERTSTPVSTWTPCSDRVFSSSSAASGSSLTSSRSAISTRVTCTPNREKTWANSQPIGPPPSTTTDAGSSVSATASRLVQYGVSSRPSIGGAPGRVPVLSTTPLRGDVRRVADDDAARPVEAGVAADEPRAAVLEPLDGDRVVPVVGGLLAHPPGDLGPVGLDLRGAGEVGHPAHVGDDPRGGDHHLRRHAAVVGALAADQAVLDADHVEPGPAELDGDVLATGAEAHHDDIDVHGLAHVATFPCRA